MHSFDSQASEEELGRQEPDDEVDVWGDQEPVDWSEQPLSDARFSEEARERLTPR